MSQPPLTIPHPEPDAVRLARIETKLDHFLATQSDQEGRLRKVEKGHTALMGGGTFLAGVVGFIGLLLSTMKDTIHVQ